ncbi:hypothetical protein J7355_11520 [Endozoicomonas sp. G2_2]|uniref:hypothetical protein n=1 Tax=Endozoicomonas sp. G2_2 TaxID=2821092 RepID=UPI001ADBDDE8|nr:hypothetical protein [Endozoicomonas sp. G2_2]MBO9470731.1 hypothetical protein [Endozoicomonas sp. G2_2]
MAQLASDGADDPLGRSAGYSMAGLFLLVVAVGALAGYHKVVLIALIACSAMCAGAALGYRAIGASVAWTAWPAAR